jgi:hypothetical protein
LESIALAIWSADEAKDQAKLPAVKEVLKSTQRLANTIEWFPAPKLTEAVIAEGAPPTLDVDGVQTWLVRLHCAQAFEQAGLLQPSEWRPAFLESTLQLARTPPADEPTRLYFRAALLDDAVGILRGLTVDAASRLYDAVGGSPSLMVSDRCLARVRVAAAARAGEDRGALVPSAQEFLAAYDQDPTEESRPVLAEAVGEWLAGCAPPVEGAWTVLERYAHERLPEPVYRGLNEYASLLQPAGRTALGRAALAQFPDRIVGDEVLEAMQFHAGDLAAEVNLVVELSVRATNEEHRRGLMRMWNALRLTDHTLIRRLLDAVMLPLVRQGKTSRDVVLQNLHLVQALPKSDKRRLAEQFQETTRDDADEWDAVAKRLVQAAFMKAGGLIVARRPEHLDR